MLIVENLQAWYGNVQALHGINLEVGRGELVTLIGSNGVGKSTTLKSIVGLLKKRAGNISFEGENISDYTPAKVLECGIALVPEGRWIFSELTVEENLKMGAFSQKKQQVIANLMEEQFVLFPILKERRNQKGGTLSGGEQQMLAISRALMAKPALLFLDEPSLGLAPQLVQSLFTLIKNLNNSGTSILLVEQNSTMALSIANRGYVLGSGKIILEGTAQELLNNPKVQQAYLGYKDISGVI